MSTVTRRPPLSWPGFLVALLAFLLLVGGLVLEVGLQRETARARATLSETLARVHPSSDPEGAAEALDAWALEVATPEAHADAATAARAAGRFDLAARHLDFARRLGPRDRQATAARDRALDLALLGRLRPTARVLALASLAFLLVGAWRRRAERRRRLRRAAWVDGLDATLQASIDGAGQVRGGVIHVGGGTASFAVDLFLTPRGAPRPPPRPGPTLSLALSRAASNRTIRLTPRRDVRDDAVRVRLKDETLASLLAVPGSWRLQARLDSRLVAEARIEVRGGEEPFGRGLHLLQPA